MEEKLLYEGAYTLVPSCPGRIGLNLLEGVLLMYVCDQEKEGKEWAETNSQIADIFSTYPAKISRAFSRLVKLGYIERETVRTHGTILKRKLRSTAKGRAALDWLVDNCDPDGPDVRFEYVEPQEDTDE